MTGVHCVPSHQRHGAMCHGSGYQFGGKTCVAGSLAMGLAIRFSLQRSGVSFDHHGVDHMVVPRLTSAVPQR